MLTWISQNGATITAVGGVIAILGAFITTRASEQKSTQLAAKSDEVAALTREIADLNAEIVAYTTGANSYVHLHVEDFGTDTPRLQVIQEGENPVRDVEILIFDISEQMREIVSSGADPEIVLDGLFRHTTSARIFHRHVSSHIRNHRIERNPTPESLYTYLVQITTSFSVYSQTINLMNVNGEWLQNYEVGDVSKGRLDVVKEYREDGMPAFPRIRRITGNP